MTSCYGFSFYDDTESVLSSSTCAPFALIRLIAAQFACKITDDRNFCGLFDIRDKRGPPSGLSRRVG